MVSKELTMYFDALRMKRGNISKLDLIEGITSPTQFRRYLNGTSPLPTRVIVAFSERLGLKYDYVLSNFDITKNKERTLINKLMNATVTYNYAEFDKIMKELDKTRFLQSENKLFFEYIVILNKLLVKKITKQHALDSLTKLIDYPKILTEKEVLSTPEFMILGEIATLLPIDDNDLAINKLESLVKRPQDIVSGNNEKLIIMLLVRIIKILGMSSEFDKALSYCLAGIKICKSTHTFYSLDYLYYYAALCYDKKENYEKRDDMIFYTIIASQVQGDLKNAEKFSTFLKNDFNIDTSSFVKRPI